MTRAVLGSWTCPSGNNVEAHYCPVAADEAVLRLFWDSPPPLQPADEAHYYGVIRPALIARLREYTERVGATLVIDLC